MCAITRSESTSRATPGPKIYPPPNPLTYRSKADEKAKSTILWPLPPFTHARAKAIQAKYCKAASYYRKAANGFKMTKQWKESAEAFVREAECRAEGDQWSDARKAYKNAAKSYKLGEFHHGSFFPSFLSFVQPN